jgi:ABC-2 type transport system ATP-binding protein
MIRTRDLGKTFLPPPWPLSLLGRHLDHEVHALQSVSLDIERGEVVGIVGPNGAGKTTLLKILSTLVLPSRGRAWIDGADVISGSAAVRRSIGLATGEERGFYWRLTGAENLEFFGGLRGFSPRESRRRASQTLERVDLLSMAREPLTRYTTGMRQRLGLARALIGNPRVLLLDEPTRSLDPMAARGVQTLIRRMAMDERVTVLIATHNLDEAEALCHRVAVLADGTVRAVVFVSPGRGRLEDQYRAILGLPS